MSFIESNDLRNEMMALSIEIVDLDEEPTPKYYVLFYEWTPPGTEPLPRRDILINGIEWRVSGDLHSALTYLQQILKGSNTKKVWIDALCINQ